MSNMKFSIDYDNKSDEFVLSDNEGKEIHRTPDDRILVNMVINGLAAQRRVAAHVNREEQSKAIRDTFDVRGVYNGR